MRVGVWHGWEWDGCAHRCERFWVSLMLRHSFKVFLLSKASEVHLVVGLLKQNFPSIVHTLTNISFFISINVFLSLSIFLYFSISLFSLSLYLLLFLSVFFFLFFYLSPINVFLSLSFYFSTSHCSFFTPICVFLSLFLSIYIAFSFFLSIYLFSASLFLSLFHLLFFSLSLFHLLSFSLSLFHLLSFSLSRSPTSKCKDKRPAHCVRVLTTWTCGGRCFSSSFTAHPKASSLLICYSNNSGGDVMQKMEQKKKLEQSNSLSRDNFSTQNKKDGQMQLNGCH